MDVVSNFAYEALGDSLQEAEQCAITAKAGAYLALFRHEGFGVKHRPHRQTVSPGQGFKRAFVDDRVATDADRRWAVLGLEDAETCCIADTTVSRRLVFVCSCLQQYRARIYSFQSSRRCTGMR